ncbi:MAG: nucleotidyltransferase family protein [Bacteroidia bacterium]|nr:nucleotidyltransferase family protein [Bacteroidia bacterium]
MIKEAIVLAGGMGTRLRSVVADVPKPMAEVNGRPFLAYLLDELNDQGIETVVLAVGYKREVITAYFGERYRNINLRYSVEEEALGTGGGIKQACEHLDGEDALVLNGDTFFGVDVQQLFHFYREKEADLVLALKEMRDFDRYGTVQADETGRVKGFEEKAHKSVGFINGGIYLFKKSLILSDLFPQKFSFEKDILEKLYPEKHFFGLAFDVYFIDIGIPQDYERSQRELAARTY